MVQMLHLKDLSLQHRLSPNPLPFPFSFLSFTSHELHKINISFIFYYKTIGPLQDPVTWYRIYYTGTQITQWDFQNKGTLTSPARLSFVLKVPLRHLRPSVIYSVPCDRILQRAYYSMECPIVGEETAWRAWK